jgi:hypothetical protein
MKKPLSDAGSVSHQQAIEKAEEEFRKYRPAQNVVPGRKSLPRKHQSCSEKDGEGRKRK